MIEEDLKTPVGRAELKKLFNLCESLDTADTYDVYNFAESLTDAVAVVVQYNNDMKGFCRTVTDKTGGARAIDRYARAQASLHGGQCIDFSYKNLVNSISHTSKHSPAVSTGLRQWTYQTCTEFGYYQTTSLKDNPFGHNIPVEFFTKQCADIFGVSAQAVQKAISQTNAYYGARKPHVTNVVLPNGSLDPWHSLGILKDINNSTKAVMIDGGSHCRDIEPNPGFNLFMGRPTDGFGFVRPPVVSKEDKLANEVKEQFYDQKLDHFNERDNRTFKQLYFMDDSNHETDGPVFLMIEGEGAAQSSWVTFSFMAQMAQKYGALAVSLEHRYYGKSIPTPDLSTQNLKYLSSEMALKDTEQFALYLTKKLSLEGSKWVVFGGSYAGALAAWFREKYPNIAVGAIASSAPVGAVVDNMGYMGVVTELLGKESSDIIRKAYIELEELLKTPEGVIKLRKTLDLCDTFDGKNVTNNHYLSYKLMWALVKMAYLVNPKDDIQWVQKGLTDPLGGTPLQRYANTSCFLCHQKCNEINYDDLIRPLRNTSIDNSGNRQWLYQTCTEFGYYQSSDLPNSPFGHNIPVEFYTQRCAQIFGPEFTVQTIQKAVDRTNAYYGGLKPNVTNVVFPNGSLDPWHALSVLKDLNNSTKAVVIEGGGHCDDIEAISGRLLFRGRPVDKHGMVRPPVAPIGHFTQSLAQTYKQKVNHLDPKDNRTFDQLYFTSGTHHKPGGPLFLFFGGEGAASAGWLESSFMADMGRKYGAYLVELEHRYYGVSQPFDELTVENMKYLSSEQALQDTDDFLHFLLKNLKLEGSKVVVFGGSYAGALAAWFREKYPKTAAGAIASSGPVEAVVDFKEYLGVVTNSLGKECSDNIRYDNKHHYQ
ncbi:unnamed protein product [Medioppia subpectinata]|uniref:Uncharacterized protein n=1 Tax=Medioppia subpectinata TaxID=1979941 RepID=A0A7R9KJI0_9ACAR|nr:unnamed protein product [Medioppia subpectinata]CAG2104830.1 unnamed protein product [Medioppia subpectinata]